MKSLPIKSIFALLAGILIAGCGGSKQQAMLDTIHSPQTRPATMEALTEDLTQAQHEQVNLISPEKYLRAQKLVQEAQAIRAEGKPMKPYNEKLGEARRELDSAMSFAKANRDRLMPLMETREIALGSGAAETTNETLKALEQRYLILVADLDRRDSRKGALDKITELTRDYQKLTIKTLQAKYLGEATNNFELAKNEGAKDLVPKTLRATEETIKKAKDYITQDQKAASIPMIDELGATASMASRRLLVLTRQAKTLKGLSLEDISLKTEALLNVAGANLEGKDLRDLSFESQAAALNQSIAGLKSAQSASAQESTRLQSHLTGSQKQISELESRTKKLSQLEQKDETDKRFESVRELFNEQEARVYRQGNKLVISLKQINFPVNQSEIPTPSYELLKKVQTAIRTFDQPAVTVEGHTDSSGDSELNKILSEKRAESVKAYLLSNSVISPENVGVVGYGAEKPLASNKSPAGRAINRRIDVVIKD